MITAQELAEAFERNAKTIKRQTDGLTHEQSLLQPPFRGNCLNWVLGHILDTRDDVVTALGESALLSQAHKQRYGYGSQPVCGDGADVAPLANMLDLLRRSQEVIGARLPRFTPEDLARKVPGHRGEVALAQRLFLLYYHETYHVGQTELLRQLAGKNDQVI